MDFNLELTPSEVDQLKTTIRSTVEKIQKEILENPLDIVETESDKNEYNIQSKRLLHILNHARKRILLALCLPQIVGNETQFQQLFNQNEQRFILKTIEKYDSQEFQLTDYLKIDPELSSLIDLVASTNLTEPIQHYENSLCARGHNFLNAFDQLIEIAKRRMQLTAPKELAKEKALQKMWMENEQLHKDVENISKEISFSEQTAFKLLASKRDVLIKQKEAIDELHKKNQNLITIKIADTETKLKELFETRRAEREQLYEKVQLATNNFDTQLAENLKIKSQLREKRAKMQHQLKLWLNKYDTEVGELTRTLLELDDEKETVTRIFQETIHKFEMQEIEYNVMAKEKEEKEMARHEERVLVFSMNRAAKIIQQKWRVILANKKKQKKRGKSKKAKK